MPWRRPYILHARTREHAHRVKQSERIVQSALDTGRLGYIALSGGKDSTCVLNLVRRQNPETPAVFSDDEWWLPETEAYLRQVDGLHWIRTNAKHTEWFQTTGDFDGIPDYALKHGWNMTFLGLRAEENARRKMYLRRYGPSYLNQQDILLVNPLARWSVRDVWGYILSRDLPYNRAYDKLREMGLPPEQQRIGPFATERALGVGQIAILKRGWPEMYNRFAGAHPEATAYA